MRPTPLVLLLPCLAGCATPQLTHPPVEPHGALRAAGVRANADPTVHGARIVPESTDGERALGAEPGGGVRAIIQGMRLVTLPTGAVNAAVDRFPDRPSSIVALPERMGGGFLFQIGNSIWHSERWLSPAHVIFQTPGGIGRLLVGLDRVYVRMQNGATLAFDARTGEPQDLGPWPASPFVVGYAAADAWRAVAVTDWRGAVATFDAGSTWRPLDLPIDARDVVVTDDAIAIGGRTAEGANVWYEVRGEGQVGKLAAPPLPRGDGGTKPAFAPLDPAARAFGAHPLVAAVEDGWPLADGTAVVARDGAVARVRLADGALLEAAADAYALKPSTCHAVSLARPADPGAFGFVCGEARGRTAVYRWDAGAARMIELASYAQPRVVLASGNGALAVRGGCAEGAPSEDADRRQQSYCLLPRDDAWREIRVSGDIGGERLVVLADGRVAVISPPRSDLANARLTVLDHGRATTVALSFPALPKDVARVLRYGTWMDGFEERAPGVLGGWVEANGAMLGVQVTLDGRTKLGRYVRDAGAPMVSGRYGLGWTGSGHGYETLDGGMTWNDVTLPPPLVTDPRKLAPRACGPIGCTAAGWLRVGWGRSAPATDGSANDPLQGVRPWRAPSPIALECDLAAGEPPETPTTARSDAGRPPKPTPRRYGGPPWGTYGGYGSWQGLTELPPFFSSGAPAMAHEDVGLAVDASEQLDRMTRSSITSARIYAWGPKADDWAHQGRWTVRWLWPFGGWPDLRATAVTPAPFANLDGARRAIGYAPGSAPFMWTLVPGDDADHALLLGKRAGAGNDVKLLALEAERPPLEVRRADGEAMGDVEATVRAAGHWYVATAQAPDELPATVIWQIDGAFAREVARVRRASLEAARAPTRLARRSDGRAIAVVVDGPPEPEDPAMVRWALPIDLESWKIGEPEKLGPTDFAGRTVRACDAASPGWVFDAPLTVSTRLAIAGATHVLSAPMARYRVSTDEACLERIAGTIDALAVSAAAAQSHHEDGRPAIAAAVTRGATRYPLRCVFTR